MSTVLQDLRFGMRMLRRNPGFSAVAIVIAALGIAAACLIFSFADAAVGGSHGQRLSDRGLFAGDAYISPFCVMHARPAYRIALNEMR